MLPTTFYGNQKQPLIYWNAPQRLPNQFRQKQEHQNIHKTTTVQNAFKRQVAKKDPPPPNKKKNSYPP